MYKYSIQLITTTLIKIHIWLLPSKQKQNYKQRKEETFQQVLRLYYDYYLYTFKNITHCDLRLFDIRDPTYFNLGITLKCAAGLVGGWRCDG